MQSNSHSRRFLPAEHTFDFKVKVNYEQGNVSIVGPHNYVPQQPNIRYIQPVPSQNSVVSSQCSEKYQIQNPQQIDCVICQKSYNIHDFQEHLQIHKNRQSTGKLSSHTQNTFSQSHTSHQSQPQKFVNYSFQKPNSNPTNNEALQSSVSSNFSKSSPVSMKNKIVSQKNSISRAFVDNSVHNSQISQQSSQGVIFENLPHEPYNIQSFQNSQNNSFHQNQLPQSSHHSSFSQSHIENQNQTFNNQNQIIYQSQRQSINQSPHQSQNQRRYNYDSFNSSEKSFSESVHQNQKVEIDPSFENYQQNSKKNHNYIYNQQSRNRSKQLESQNSIVSSQQQFSEQKMNPFQKRALSVQLELLKYEFDSDEQDVQSLKVKQPLQNLSKEDLIKIYHNKSNSQIPHEQEIAKQSRISNNNLPSLNLSGISNRFTVNQQQDNAESFNLNEVMIKNIQSRHIVRGVQVNEPSIMNNSKISNTSQSSKKRLPKNYLARNDFIQTNSTTKSQKK